MRLLLRLILVPIVVALVLEVLGAVALAFSDPTTSITKGLLASFPWWIDVVDHHEGFFVFLATAFLAGFTATLWNSTEKLWKAGETQGHLAAKMADIAEKQLAIQAAQTDLQTKQHQIA